MDIGFLDDFPLTVLMRDAPADRLIAQSEVAVQPVGRGAEPLRLEPHRVVAHNRILDVGDDIFPGYGFDMMGIDVADKPVLEPAQQRVASGMGEDVAGVGMNADLLYGRILRPDLALDVHDLSPAE